MGELRIGTRERELAMSALDEHLRAGRLDALEYAERSATASTARVRSELDALFVDLPDPHPAYPGSGTAAAVTGSARPSFEKTPAPGEDELPELVRPLGSVIGRHAGLLSALTPVVIFLLVAASGFRLAWLFLLVPVLLVGIGWLGHREDRGGG